ncbi:MAG: hypothetical protein A3F46_05800 [Legionellales bacterium RIFCSPHIGHO2_12_FULL_42_9]|nr:MAG: hypothetical protein A3F46_05800 [Legionellales bacterium RIFCSPHIGHO2_12_FULL_42_9]
MRRGIALATVKDSESYLLHDQYIHHPAATNNRAILLLHGFGSSPAVFRILMPYLTKYNAISIPALPGHGSNIQEFSDCMAQDWLIAAEVQLQNLYKKFSLVDVLGFSLGGILALQLNTKFSINHLYLLAPALSLRIPIPITLLTAKLLRYCGFSNLRNSAGNLYTNTCCEIAYRQLPLNAIIELLNLINDFKFSQPHCPTDVFLGAHDTVLANTKIKHMFHNMEHTTLHTLKNSAHVLPLDMDCNIIGQYISNNF